MNKNKINKLYKTSSLPVACVLSMGFPLFDIDKTDPKRALFVFEESPELEDAISSYWEGALKVDPQAYFNQLKVLKARLYGD
ncbi:MAG: hypothetical protein UV28_C0008G0014 [Candidatus Collierbacteria bacterium GW2011_GWE2_42_48]|nr:MAG: hypothetical protein UV28_C0008G0014 [Candidatus Collierbacteria bacterium GW2011_GWE2_42_48]